MFTVRLFILLTLLLTPLSSAASGSVTPDGGSVTPDGKVFFKAGLQFYKKGDPGSAINSLARAWKGLPVIGDYTLLYMSKAYLETGNTGKSLKSIRKLMSAYPESLLKKEARGIEVLNVLTLSNEDRALELLESYVKDYPSDRQMRFLLGYLIKGTDPDKARQVFKELYITARGLSMEAYRELEPSDIQAGDLLKRASNLIRAFRYKEAERCLASALKEDDGTLRKDIQEKLGLALFKQKNYKKAAKIYLKADDLYNAARAFFRAGKMRAFRKTLKKLLLEEDERAASLLLAYACEKRRKGKTSDALRLLSEAGAKFPSVSEAALWNAGWTQYLNRDYKEALTIFSGLYESSRRGQLTPNSTKYLYWKAKAVEKTGEDATHIYLELTGGFNSASHGGPYDFYGFLATLKTEGISLVSAGQTDGFRGNAGSGKGPSPTAQGRAASRERVDILIAAGLQEEAAAELIYAAKKAKSRDALLHIASRLKEMGRYREAMLIMTRLPAKMRPAELFYPLAYWPTIKEMSLEHKIDPFLLLAVIREESRFDPRAHSPAGAIGLMQLMPATASRTARDIDIKITGSEHIYEVELNIKLGTLHLSRLMKRLKSVSAALAAYNAGESRVKKWLSNGRYDSYDDFIEDIPYAETKNYIKRIITSYFQYRKALYPQHSSKPGTATF